MAMLYLFLFVSLALGSPAGGAANNKLAAARTESVSGVQPVSLLGGRLSLSLPVGFRTLAFKKATRRFADNDAPRYLYSNTGQTAYIKIYYGETEIGPQDLVTIKGFVELTQKDYSGWITSELILLNGTLWFHFEWEKPIDNSPLAKLVPPKVPGMKIDRRKDMPEHFEEYSASLDHYLLHIVYEADVEKYPQMKNGFDSSIASIKVKSVK